MDGGSALSIASNACQDLVRRLGPNERCGIFIVDVDVFTNGGFQFLHTAKHTAANPFVGKFSEPSLHQVQPRAIGGREVNVKSGALSEPLPDDGRFVRAVVVHDDLNVESGRHLMLDQVEELAELHRAMAVTQLADHPVGLQLQRRKQRSSSIAFVVVRATLYLPGL
jgi:hypothetical protein